MTPMLANQAFRLAGVKSGEPVPGMLDAIIQGTCGFKPAMVVCCTVGEKTILPEEAVFSGATCMIVPVRAMHAFEDAFSNQAARQLVADGGAAILCFKWAQDLQEFEALAATAGAPTGATIQ